MKNRKKIKGFENKFLEAFVALFNKCSEENSIQEFSRKIF